MSILIFLVVLVALIVVHELGHFFAAKWFGMRVEEFGLGYPPRAATLATKNGTEYTLNWLPFGGFVKISGEDESHAIAPDSFAAKPRYQQAIVLLAGILMNLLFAWVLLTIALVAGMPRGLTQDEIAKVPDASLAVYDVLAGSPAAQAGLMRGDILKGGVAGDDEFSGADVDGFTSFVAAHPNVPIVFDVERSGEHLSITATPESGTVKNAPERAALGVGVAPFGTLRVPLLEAPIEGARITVRATKETAKGLLNFFGGLFTFTADLSQVSGPVGIAGAVGAASASSFAALLSLVAIISINLALINIVPVPALDGGRLLFVLIEAILRRPLPSGIANVANTIGFGLLILLMVIVTGSDILKLFA